jgi:hypothetical protein
MTIYHTSAIRGDNIQVMFKELILSILQNQLLVRQIKGTDDIDDKLSNDKQERRQTSIIQLFSRTPSDRNNSDRSSTVNCCKLA